MRTRIVTLEPFVQAIVVEEMEAGQDAALRTWLKSFETYHALCLVEYAWHPVERLLYFAVLHRVRRKLAQRRYVLILMVFLLLDPFCLDPFCLDLTSSGQVPAVPPALTSSG